MIVTIILAVVICTPFGLLSMVVPRTQADYVAVSRILHPSLALGSAFAYAFSSILSMAYYAFGYTWWGLTPTLSIIGATTGNLGLVTLGGTLSNWPWNFLIGLAGIALCMGWVAVGMRRMMFFQNVLFAIGMIGLVVAGLIMATTTRSVFMAQFNAFAQPFTNRADSYDYIIQQAAAEGMQYKAGAYTFSGTVSVIPAIMASGVWTFSSVALTGEIKNAASRKQWYSMMLAAVLQYVIIIIMVLLIFNTIGEQFIGAANYLYSVDPTKYAIPVAPMLPLLVALIPGGIIIPWILVLTFIPWTPLIHYIQFAIPSRSVFAWSFDRLLPEKAAAVDDRTHGPLIAVVGTGLVGVALWVWAVSGAGFLQLLILAALAGDVTLIVVGFTAIVFPYIKKEMYQSSPAKIEVAGIPLISISGVVTVIAALWVCYMYLIDPRLGITNPMEALIFTVAMPVGCIVYYYIARAYRMRQGLNLDLVFKMIPPE
jgi:amino acid transporter